MPCVLRRSKAKGLSVALLILSQVTGDISDHVVDVGDQEDLMEDRQDKV